MKNARWMWIPVGLLALCIAAGAAGLYGYFRKEEPNQVWAHVGLFVLFMFFPIISFLFDFCLYKANRQEKTGEVEPYRPRPHIWGLGLFLGTGSVILYFLSIVTLSLLGEAPATNLALVQNLFLFIVHAVLLGIIVLAILKVYRPE